MKKILYTIGFLMFFSAFFSPILSHTVLGASTVAPSGTDASGCSFPWTNCNVTSRLQVNIPDANWGDVFGTDDPNIAGQDLYTKVYQMTKLDPDRNAMKNIAGSFGTTEASTVRLLNNDFGPLLDSNPSLTQLDAIQKMTEIQQSYQDEKDLLQFQSDINATVMPGEIFANGDISDSGFDLIIDLQNIEKLLFLKSDPIDIGASFSSSPGAGGGGTGGMPSGTGSPTGPSATPAASTGKISTSLTTGGGAGGLTPASGAGSAVLPGAGNTSPENNPNICLTGTGLNTALQNFENNKQKDSRLKETPTVTPSAQAAPSAAAPSGTGNAGAIQAVSSATPAEFVYREPETPPVEAAPAGSWLQAIPCGDILCITIDFINKPASAYINSDNCIACHIEKIDEKLKETINHSLIPAKATGNLLEPGVCKIAAANLFRSAGIRFYAIARPIQTPTNDDLIYGTSIDKAWEKFVNTYKPFPFYTKNVPAPSTPNVVTTPPSEADRAAKVAVAVAGPDTTLSTVNQRIQAQLNSTAQARSKAVAVAAPAVKSDTDSGFYQAIQRELEQMNYYFQAFQDILHSLSDNVDSIPGDHACQTIKNIKECQ